MKTEIKNLKKAAARILAAIKNRENVLLYGDADLDGVSSVIILKEAIKSLGGKVAAVYFPDREKEGYGITTKGLRYLKKYSPALLIALDCGIGNFKEVETARAWGLETIIIDHHEILDGLPKASIIVDPKQKDDEYSFKYFATAGLAFKLAEAMFQGRMPDSFRNNLLELAALATISDMMPKVSENAKIISHGLNSISSSWRPAIQTLFHISRLKDFNFLEKVYKINSLLNVRDVKERLPAAYRLLISPSKKEAAKLTERLYKKGRERARRIAEITEEVESRILKKGLEPIIFDGKSSWELAYLGVVASILTQRYKKAIFLYKEGKIESQGGARAPKGFNLVEAMKGFSKNLITYGGHPQAGGFRIKNEYLKSFKEHLAKYSSNL